MIPRSATSALLVFYGIASGLIGLGFMFYPFSPWCIVAAIFFFGLYGASYATFLFDTSCPIDDSCPFKDRIIKGHWEEKK